MTRYWKIIRVVVDGDFTLGRAVDEFEERFAQTVNSKYAIGVGSGTDALFLSLRAFDIGNSPLDEVITSPFTFYATIGAIVTAGAKPKFVDIGEDFSQSDKIEEAISEHTKAIVPIHWSGRPCDMSCGIWKIADKYNLKIIEDACHAITATYHGKMPARLATQAAFQCTRSKISMYGETAALSARSQPRPPTNLGF